MSDVTPLAIPNLIIDLRIIDMEKGHCSNRNEKIVKKLSGIKREKDESRSEGVFTV